MKEIYLDNSATTALCDEAKDAMRGAMENYGNPSSLHARGNDAHKILETARRQVLTALGVRGGKDESLIFTSCGTEANSLALFGTAHAKERRVNNRIISTDSEHPSVENALRALEKEGFEVLRLSTKHGVLDPEEFRAAMNERTLLVSLMTVNNETGAAYDVSSFFKEAKRICPEVVTHTDAVQGFMKVAFSPSSVAADLVTVSGHKIHGPKGTGALYISPDILKRKQIVPFLLGGGQEFSFRSGTENTIGIAGFGAAAESLFSRFSDNEKKMRALRDYAIERLPVAGVRLNLPNGASAPHILHLTLPQIKSETMVHFLSSYGIYVSGGSACSSHGHSPSRSLLGFGLSAADADCSLRISLCEDNVREDIDALAAVLTEGIGRLVRIR